MKLTPKEKLFIFNVLHNTEQEMYCPEYTDEFASDSITEEEFNAMADDRKIGYYLRRHLLYCESRVKDERETKEQRRKIDDELKDLALLGIYNRGDDILKEWKEIQPVVIELIDKFFAGDKLDDMDFNKLWERVKDDGTDLIANAFMEVIHGERNIRQCSYCQKLFLPTPHGKKQKFCSAKCRRRHHYEKTGY